MTLQQRIEALATRIANHIRDNVLTRVLPTGGTAGQVLAKVDATNYNTGWVAQSGGASVSSKRTVFTASGTWTKDTRSKLVRVRLWGPGGGAAGGGVQVSGSAAAGAAGGGGGGYIDGLFAAADLGATETVTVPAGALGGAGRVSTTGNGINGNNAPVATFGNWLSAFGGNGAGANAVGSGSLGASGAGAGQLPGGSYFGFGSGGAGVGGNANFPNSGGAGAGCTNGGGPGQNGGSSVYGSSGGASGGGIPSASPVGQFGGNGGRSAGYAVVQVASLQGGNIGLAGETRVVDPRYQYGGFGGGGGGSATTVNGGAGGNGQTPGGGGGGGGPTLVGFNGGKGGDGGNGLCVIEEIF